jgi:restriction system protein
MGGTAKPREIALSIAISEKLPDEVLEERYAKSGSLKFMNQLAWCRQYMIWEGLLDSSKHGVWTLSKKGWDVELSRNEVDELVIKWSRYFQEIKTSKGSANPDEAEVVESLNELEEEKNRISTLSLIDILKGLTPTGFEHICGRLLREYDFENIEITQRSHDGGIDGFATLKINPLINMSVYFQCKRYEGTVPLSKVQEFVGVLETNRRSVEKGLILTTGSFSRAALEIETVNNKLELIDGDTLVDMFIKKGIGLNQRTVYEPDLAFFELYQKM